MSGPKNLKRHWLAAATCTYLLVVVALTAGLRMFGERWWWMVALLYVPRPIVGLPLLVLVPLTLLSSRRWWLAVDGAATLVLLFPLMGLELAHPRAGEAQTLRLISFNVWYGRRGVDAVVDALKGLQPDVVVLQALSDRVRQGVGAAFPGWHEHATSEFMIASRFPILDVVETPPLPSDIPAASIRYTLETPLGPIDVLNVHAFSPRDAFERVRGPGLHSAVRYGMPPDAIAAMKRNAEIRASQVRALGAAAAQCAHRVVIAGDTNLPTLDPLLDEYLHGYRDGFAQAGIGFGYTFPTHRLVPWLRLDRVLTGPGLRVVRFRVGDGGASDHAPVSADIAAD